jgi:hypothetical protein
MKLGNTTFDKAAFAGWSFEQFRTVYAGLLDGIDITEAFNILTDGKHIKPHAKAASVRPIGKRGRSGKGK